jgi:hypothetical protein
LHITARAELSRAQRPAQVAHLFTFIFDH